MQRYQKEPYMRIFAYIFWILVVLIGVSFSALNARSVEIHYYVGKINIYLPLLLFIVLAFGALLGVIAMFPYVLKLKAALRRLRHDYKEIKSHES